MPKSRSITKKSLKPAKTFAGAWNQVNFACRHGELEKVVALVNKWQQMHLEMLCVKASRRGYLDIVRFFIRKGANLEFRNSDALCSAAENGHYAVVEYLVRKGARINAAHDYAFRWAAINGYLEIVVLLVSKGADIHAFQDHALREAAARGRTDVVIYLCSRGADIHALDDEAIKNAAEMGNTEIVHHLLLQGANGAAALVCAAACGQLAVVEMLISIPVDLSAGYHTAWQKAKTNDHYVVADVLRQAMMSRE